MTPPSAEQALLLNDSLPAMWRRLALTLWIVAVASLSIFSLLPAFAPPGDYGFDKLIHGTTYTALALLAHVAFEQRKNAVAAALSLIPLGCAIELAQAFVPGRSGDFWDALANSAGVLVGVALGIRFRRFVAAAARKTR
jgi:VanZ family protein